MSLRRKIFYGFTLAVVAVLLFLPATGWLARAQLLPIHAANSAYILSSGSSPLEPYEKRCADIISRHGNDFDLLYAHALGGSAEESMARLKVLGQAYPDNPVILSAELKNLARGAVKLRRSEENLLSTPSRRAKTDPVLETVDTSRVAEFIALAEAGERLEPENAFFPAMATWGYFAVRKDGEAAAAWIRAGNKKSWDEHNNEEIGAKWKLQRAVYGGSETGAIARMGTMAAVLFPHYAGIRGTARMAAVTAMQFEQRGDKEAGFFLRRASRQIGLRMQEQSKAYIGNLVGRAVVSLAASRAGGAEVAENPYKGKDASERWIKERQMRYAEYLRTIGHPEEATAYTNAIADGRFLQTLFSRTSPRTYWGFDKQTIKLMGGWLASFMLLAGVLFSLAFAGIFKLIYRYSPRLQQGEPLQKSARCGLAQGTLLPILVVASMLFSESFWLEPELGSELLAVLGGIVLLSLVVLPLLLRLSAREFGHALTVAVGTWCFYGVLVGVGVLCIQFAKGVTDAIGLFSLSSTGGDGSGGLLKSATPWILGLIVLSVPLGLVLLFGICSKILRVPFAAGVTRGMRAMAVPLACLLTLAWSGVLIYTLGHEKAAIAEMQQMAKMGEMQYLRQLEGPKSRH